MSSSNMSNMNYNTTNSKALSEKLHSLHDIMDKVYTASTLPAPWEFLLGTCINTLSILHYQSFLFCINDTCTLFI